MIRTSAVLTDEAAAMLRPAIERGGHKLSDIARRLSEGRALLWIAPTGCILTEVDQNDICTVLLGGGSNARRWVRGMEAAVIAHPAHAEVKAYQIVGRAGWRRLFPHWRHVGEHDGCTVLERAA